MMEGEGEMKSVVEDGLVVTVVDKAVTAGAAALLATGIGVDMVLDTVALVTLVTEADVLSLLLLLTVAVFSETTELGVDTMLLNEGSLAVTEELAVTV